MRGTSFGLALFVAAAAHAATPPPRDVDIAAPDGAILKATYFAASAPGPAVILLHMCNADRTSWEPVGRQLSAAGIHALTIDYRGFGQSDGERFATAAPEVLQKMVREQWPGDVDAAFAWLGSQAGVDRTRMGAGGGSCGVTQAVRAAARHPEIRSLVLLAGDADQEGLAYLRRSPWLPIFVAAAADDQFDRNAPASMRWLADMSANPRNKSMSFPDGRHGTEIFGPHPELPRAVVAWYLDTLVTAPADPKATVQRRTTPALEFWTLLDRADGVAGAERLFHDERKRDPAVFLFPETVMNRAGYERLQDGRQADAIALFSMNVEAYPSSANAQDSLGDAYLAAGQDDRALAAARKCLELLPADPLDERFKDAIRRSAEQKIQKLTAATPR